MSGLPGGSPNCHSGSLNPPPLPAAKASQCGEVTRGRPVHSQALSVTWGSKCCLHSVGRETSGLSAPERALCLSHHLLPQGATAPPCVQRTLGSPGKPLGHGHLDPPITCATVGSRDHRTVTGRQDAWTLETSGLQTQLPNFQPRHKCRTVLDCQSNVFLQRPVLLVWLCLPGTPQLPGVGNCGPHLRSHGLTRGPPKWQNLHVESCPPLLEGDALAPAPRSQCHWGSPPIGQSWF